MDKSLVLTKAKGAVMSHDFVTAARLYKELLADDASNVEYLKQLGSIYVQAGQDEKAIPYYDQIITFYPHYVEAMNSLGAIYRRLKRYDESIAILQRALDEDRQLPTVNYNLGFTYKEMGNYEDAIEAFEMVIQANPDDVLAYNHLGSIYFAQKNYEKSITSYKRGLQIDRNHPILNYNLARVYQAASNEADAIRCYQTALKTRPGWKDAITDYSSLLLHCQKNKEAADLVQQAIKLHPKDGDLLNILGQVYLNEYDYKNAEQSFKKADALKGNDVRILSGLAKALEKGEKVDKALDTVLSAMEIDPYNKDIKKQYVHTLLSAEDYDTALQNVKELYDDGGDRDLQVLDLYGQYYATQNDDENAKVYFDKIQKINHHYKEHMVSAAERYAQIGQYEKAETYAQNFVKARPQRADGYTILGKISENQGNLETAKQYYAKSSVLKNPNILAAGKIQEINKQLELAGKSVEVEPLPDVQPEVEETQESVQNEELQENEDFDFDQMGGNIPLQEGLIEDENAFFEEENPEEAEEETIEEEETPEDDSVNVDFGNEDPLMDSTPLQDLANMDDDEPFDFGEPVKETSDDEALVDQNEAREEPEEDFDMPMYSTPSAATEEPISSESVPVESAPVEAASVAAPVEAAPAQSQEYQQQLQNELYQEQMARMMSEQAMRSTQMAAQQAMQTALEAQKMAEQLADEQFLLRKETESALQEALEKVKTMQEEQLKEQERKFDNMLENAEQLPDSENSLSSDDLDFGVEFEEETPVEVAVEETTEENSEEITLQIPEEEISEEIETEIESESEAAIEFVEESEISEDNNNVEIEEKSENDYLKVSEEYENSIEGDTMFVNVDELTEELEKNLEIKEQVFAEQSEIHFDNVDDLISEMDQASDAFGNFEENSFATEEPVFESESEPVFQEEVAISEEENFPTVENVITEETAYASEAFPTVDNIISENEVFAEEESCAAEESGAEAFPTVDNIISENEVYAEEESYAAEESGAGAFPTVDNILDDNTAMEEESGLEFISDYVEPEQEEEPVQTPEIDTVFEYEEAVKECFAEETPESTILKVLAQIQENLMDKDKASSNAEKIEMFKMLRVLSGYLPVQDQSSFQACRNRMIIDYLIAKMSGKPGLLKTTQSLIDSGVLGEQKSAESDEEVTNDMIERVLIKMRQMAGDLEDKQLSDALCVSVDNILERLEILDNKGIELNQK